MISSGLAYVVCKLLVCCLLWQNSNISSGLSMLSSKSASGSSSSCVARPYSMKGSISGRVWPSKEFSGTGELPLTLVEDRFLFNEHRWLSIATVMQTLSWLLKVQYVPQVLRVPMYLKGHVTAKPLVKLKIDHQRGKNIWKKIFFFNRSLFFNSETGRLFSVVYLAILVPVSKF